MIRQYVNRDHDFLPPVQAATRRFLDVRWFDAGGPVAGTNEEEDGDALEEERRCGECVDLTH